MSNITKNLNIYKDVTNLIGARSFGKEDLVVPYRQFNGTKDGDAYILPAYTVGNYSWEFNVKIRLSASDISREFKISDTPVDLRGFRIYVGDGKFNFLVSYGSRWVVYSGFSGINDVIPNTTYWIKAGFNAATNEYYLSYSLDNVTFIKDISYTSSDKHVPYTPQKLFIKAIKKTEYLEDCYMVVNGVEVWRVLERTSTISRNDMQNYVLSGIEMQPVVGDSKAVIDFSNVKLPWKFEHKDKLLTSRFAIAPLGTTVTQPKYVKDVSGHWVNKRLNCNIVGSPIVSEDFVASGFDTNKYFTYTLQEALGNDYEVLLKFHTSNTAQSGGQVILSLADGRVPVQEMQNIYIALSNAGTMLYAKTGNGSTNTLDDAGLSPIQNNTDYYIKLVSTPSSTTFYASTTGFTNMTMLGTVNASLSLTNKLLKFGYDVDNTAKSYLKGSIDFKECSIKKNGVEIWRGVEDLGTENLKGCIRYYFGHKPDATTPPEDSSNTYNVYAVNGDEGIVLDSKWYDYGGLTTRPILGDGPVPDFENEWYLGEYRIETGEEGSPYSPDGGYFPGGGIVLT